MTTEGCFRKTFEEEEERLLRKSVKYLTMLERAEAKNESEETQDVVELAVMEVKEVERRTAGETQFKVEGGGLDPEQSRQGREEEMNCTVKMLGMFEFVSC